MLRITIPCPYDMTPLGKRSARCVQVSGRMGRGRQLRWYVGGRLYNRLAVTGANAELTRAWIANAGAADNRPQPWESFR